MLHAKQVSIHALTKSATLSAIQENTNRLCFNPRTHEECDYDFLYSISRQVSFNPRTHEECDDMTFVAIRSTWLFQSTHSRRVRLRLLGRRFRECRFQSTHSRRVRLFPCIRHRCISVVSIHALTKSATVISVKRRTHPLVSIHALTKSAT